MTAPLSSAHAFSKEALLHINNAETEFVERLRCHYSQEAQEILKSVRLPTQIFSEGNAEWDLDMLKVINSLRV